MTRDVFVEGLLVTLNQVKKQNDWLLEQNQTLSAQNKTLLDANNEMRTYCSSISGLGDTVLALMNKLEDETRKTDHIGDSLIMLWGQLTVCGILDEKRQMHMRPNFSVPVSPAAPVAGVSVSDLFCNESLSVASSSSSGLD